MKIAIEEAPGSVLFLDPEDVFYIEATGEDTRVRTARRRIYEDPRPISRWEEILEELDFFRIHRSFLVNLDRVQRLRRRDDTGRDWEIKMEPPVNTVLPVSREARRDLGDQLGF